MDREELYEFLQAFIHIAIELGKWCQVVPYEGGLVRVLLEQAVSYHKLNVSASNHHLDEAVLYTAQGIGNEGKP